MKRFLILLAILVVSAVQCASASGLPFSTVFKGTSKFDALVREAAARDWASLPIGERVATVGRAMCGTPYKSYTLEIDNHIEAASVNLLGMDCWTFFEQALAFARMLNEPRAEWTPQTMLHYVELDRYRGGHCTGQYLSRLHYLEDWSYDNQRRGLVVDLTRDLGGERVSHHAIEMTVHWRSYRYLRNNPDLRAPLRDMEERVTSLPMVMIPKSRVRSIEPRLRDGDIICVVSYDGHGEYSTAHVGLISKRDGVAHFMHASAPWNYNRVVIDRELAQYLAQYHSDAGIMVVRPLK